MSGEIKVLKISPTTGTDVTMGDSSDNFIVPAGVTLDVNGIIDLTGATTTGFPITQEVGTWTSTVRFMTTLTNTNYDSTTTMTGNYVRIGKYYSCHLPTFSRTNLGIAVNWLMHSFSLPVTTGSTNYSLRTTSVYNMKGRWNTAEYSSGQIVCSASSGTDYAYTQYQALDGAGGSLFPYANTSGSEIRCVIDFWVD